MKLWYLWTRLARPLIVLQMTIELVAMLKLAPGKLYLDLVLNIMHLNAMLDKLWLLGFVCSDFVLAIFAGRLIPLRLRQ